MLATTLGGASAAHNGNNKASLTGVGAELDATGTAIVNYRAGTDTYNGTVVVRNLEPNTEYTFEIRAGAGNEQEICDGVSNNQGLFRCSSVGFTLTTDPNTFGSAAVRLASMDEEGADVATGTFARRGNCRDADQGLSQCESDKRNTQND